VYNWHVGQSSSTSPTNRDIPDDDQLYEAKQANQKYWDLDNLLLEPVTKTNDASQTNEQ
jgi:hypothetical protein